MPRSLPACISHFPVAQALLRLAAHPDLDPDLNAAVAHSASLAAYVTSCRMQLHAAWPSAACALVLQPCLDLPYNGKPLHDKPPYECTFHDYTPSLGMYGMGGAGGSLYGGRGGSAAAAALQTPAFLVTQVRRK